MELFRSEVEAHSEALSAALLALERSPEDISRLDAMMRAAHSIKGAARVVGVDAMVGVSHAMEDCFVAAQRGRLTLSPAGIDVLLRGVDLMGKIAAASKDPQVDLMGRFDGPARGLVAELESLLAGGGRIGDRPGPATTPAPAPAGRSPASPGALRGADAPSPATIVAPELLDEAAAERLRRQYLDAQERGCDPIRLDLRSTRDLDVQGLALLAAMPRHAAQLGRPRLQLAGVSDEMETVLGVTGLGGSYEAQAGSAREGG
ncbi:Chemotaxis protein CheA [Aquisphaera giovannonii]|uniref:Chemotaxis protein CheA n=2 Tax=Aquisphaera giovannonii TaxID=406548 RepID=A0A5B9VX90_9BACT|nr:Chemotaxis protein CheA [Aquisphaera giovannonii]